MEIGIWENVQKTEEKSKDGHSLYIANCKFCGKQYKMRLIDLKGAKRCKHIKTGIKNIGILKIFISMKSRCYNENDKSFRFYGKKGIKICEEWLSNPKSFEKWSFENGYEKGLSIDRIDSSSDYSPKNCRWIPVEKNCKYKSTTIIINVDGEEKTGRDWAKELRISTNIINQYRRKYGYENTVEFIRRALKYGIPKLEYGESYYEKLMPD